MHDFKRNFSRRILLRLLVLALVLGAVIATNLDFVANVYFRNQLTQTGLLINGGIALLFLVGLARLGRILFRYAGEEKALAEFAQRIEKDQLGKPDKLDNESLIYQRFRAVVTLSRQNAPVNHSALAAMLAADEHTRISFPKFINNILILTGVFGTIVSLSIALIGASDMLNSPQDMSNMGLIIHGMSTALSTTITAIVCYLFYGYAFLKLTDAQTHLLTGIEQVTTLYLMPRYGSDRDAMLEEVAGLVKGLREAAGRMHEAQAGHDEAVGELRELYRALHGKVDAVGGDLDDIKGLLGEGFRLPARGENQ